MPSACPDSDISLCGSFCRRTDIEVRRGFTDIEETGTVPCELLGFTVSWELDFIHILGILQKQGISLLADKRTDDMPLIFGGGPVLSSNPEALADFFDVILLGDAEVSVPQFIDAYKESRRLKKRKDRLLALSQIPGLYVPGLYQCTFQSPDGPIAGMQPAADGVPAHVGKRVFVPPDDYAVHSVFLSRNTAFSDTFLVEVARSCPQECRFCLAGFLNRPFRPVGVQSLLSVIDLGLRHTNKIGLLGPSVTEHPDFELLAASLMERKDLRIAVSSVRADSLSEPVLRMLRHLGQKSVTIAIESGSQRLRSIMRKNLTEAAILQAVDLIDAAGLEGVKFYGIAGLPHETQEDLEETIRLIKQIKKTHRRLRLVLGLSSFVPKAQTPFQWSARDKMSKQKLEYVNTHLKRVGVDVRVESHNWSDIQALLSRGDRRLSHLLVEVFHDGGNLGAWKKAFRHLPAHCPGLEYYAFRDIPHSEILPWAHLVEDAKMEYFKATWRSKQDGNVNPIRTHELPN